jgi:hypothetical protein
MISYDELCDRCGYPNGLHKTIKLGWEQASVDGTKKEHVSFWQAGLCPDSHNMQQPSWDMYLFQYKVNGKLTFPYEDIASRKMRESRAKRKAANEAP